MNKQEKQESLTISEIDEKLLADADGSYLKSLLEKLKPYQESVKSKMDGGSLAPREFEAAKAIHEGLKQAEAMLRDWENVKK